MSCAIASRAASLISAGALKSGNPCARFSALCAIASRLISRMTDSVKCAVRALRKRRRGAISRATDPIYSSLLRPVQPAVQIRVAQHELDVLPRLGYRDRLDKFRGLLVLRPREPLHHSRLPAVVRRE